MWAQGGVAIAVSAPGRHLDRRIRRNVVNRKASRNNLSNDRAVGDREHAVRGRGRIGAYTCRYNWRYGGKIFGCEGDNPGARNNPPPPLPVRGERTNGNADSESNNRPEHGADTG